MTVVPCGTSTAYRRHMREGQRWCELCLMAGFERGWLALCPGSGCGRVVHRDPKVQPGTHCQPRQRCGNLGADEARNVARIASLVNARGLTAAESTRVPKRGANGSEGRTGPRPHGPRWEGRAGGYQDAAATVLWVERAATVQPWHWITADCDDPLCLHVWHLRARAPRALQYPEWVCVYCGLSGDQRDHLLPEPLTGKAARRHVLTVPACGSCNQAISDHPSACVSSRRHVAHVAIRRKFATLLDSPAWSAEEIRERFEGRLRQYVEQSVADRAVIVSRLNWPEDPSYDLRALQRSGIDDPFATGLLSGPVERRRDG